MVYAVVNITLKSALSLNNLKILRPKVTKNLTNLRKKFCESPPWSLNWTITEYWGSNNLDVCGQMLTDCFQLSLDHHHIWYYMILWTGNAHSFVKVRGSITVPSTSCKTSLDMVDVDINKNILYNPVRTAFWRLIVRDTSLPFVKEWVFLAFERK